MKISQKMWSLECSQVFSMIWPTDPVFDPGRSIFELDQVWWRLDQNCGLYGVHKVFLWFDLLTYFLTRDDQYSILAKVDKFGTKTVASRVFTRFFHDLTYWPSFWPTMIHIQFWPISIKTGPKLWPLECSKGFSIILTYWPSFWPGIIHIQSWLSLIRIGPKLWPLECSQGFSMIWPTDLVFDPGWSIFNLVQVWWRLDQNCGL